MRKKIVWIASVTVALLATGSGLFSGDFRSPTGPSDGPQRHLFEMDKAQEGKNFKIWSTTGNRHATRCFKDKVGTKTEPLTALIFGKENFRLTEAFPRCYVNMAGDYYNPLLRTTRLYTAAHYNEKSLTFGASWQKSVADGKGKVGFRVQVPFKRIEMERIDQAGVRSGAELQDVLSVRQIEMIPNNNLNPYTSIGARLDFIEALRQNATGDSMISYNVGNGLVNIGGQLSSVRIGNVGTGAGGAIGARAVTKNIPSDAAARDGAGGASNAFPASRQGVLSEIGAVLPDNLFLQRGGTITYSQEGIVPESIGRICRLARGNLNVWALLGKNFYYFGALEEAPSAFPTTAEIESGKYYVFWGGRDYSGLSDAVNGKSVDAMVRDQDLKASCWVLPWIPKRVAENPLGTDDAAIDPFNEPVRGTRPGGALKIIKDLSEQITENAYEWLHDRGYDLESQWRTGLGDADVDAYYCHDFSDKFVAEGRLGLRVPTSSGKDLTGNPYKVVLGNCGHWEVKVGGMGAFQPMSWVNIKLDGLYSFVLKSTEKRCAVWKDSRIKNMGPAVDADVSWSYFVGKADLVLFHPKTKAISTTLGYEFLKKNKETVTFSKSTMNSWLWRDTTTNQASSLDNELAAARTDGIAHKVRFETSMRVTKQCELYLGGTYAFAGKNMPREIDCNVGFNAVF